MRLFETPDYKFVENRRKGYIFSGILLVASILSLIFVGLELGIDFKGGQEFVIETDSEVPVEGVRALLEPVLGSAPEVKTYTADNPALLIRASTAQQVDINETQTKIIQALESGYENVTFMVSKRDTVSPRFAEDLQRGAYYSIIGALFVIFVYILIRFEWRFGVGAVAALFHDVTITLGLFSMFYHIMPFSLQIDQAIIAAFLTIVGYSLNDTVVIFDRIREYSNVFKTLEYGEVVNRSINQTLSRTVVTSLTTLFVVVILLIFGGEVLRGFAFALTVGILIGTYSSIYVASPIVVELSNWKPRRKSARK